MQFTQSISYPGTVEEVVAMYLTPAYLERRFGQFVVEGSQAVSVEGERVSFAGTVRPELIPAAAALAPADAGSVRVVTGNVSVRVPLLGGRIEKEAVAHLGRVVEREQALATQWLEEHR